MLEMLQLEALPLTDTQSRVLYRILEGLIKGENCPAFEKKICEEVLSLIHNPYIIHTVSCDGSQTIIASRRSTNES